MSSESVPSTPLSAATPTLHESAGDASLLTEEEMASSRCCTCHKPIDLTNSLVIVRSSLKAPEVRRCKSCHSVRAAIERLKKNHGNLVKDWSKITGDKVSAFFQDYPHLRGDELRQKIEEIVQDWKTETTRYEFNSQADFMDETDLKKKYHDKPEILENILRNGRQFFCPVKKIMLYGDPKYDAKVSDQTEYGHTEKRKAQTMLRDNTEPENKKGRRNKKDDNKEEEQKLKAGEKKKIAKKAEALGSKVLQLKDLLGKCSEYGNMIPPYVVNAGETGITKAQQTMTETQALLDAGKGDGAAALEKLDETSTHLADCCSRVKSQLEQAAHFK